MNQNQRPSSAAIYGLAVASLAAIVISFSLFVSFALGSTQYFLLAGLSDPSQPGNVAGRFFGTVIALVAFVTYTLATWRYFSNVVSQVAPFDRACEEWRKVSGKEALVPDSAEATQLVENLRGIPPTSRLGKVVASWTNASPYSDAEAILDAEANPYRNFLNFLSSIASVLVLIGLVGNFFGLAEAARRLPELADVTSAKMTSTTTIQAQSQHMGNAEKMVGKEQSSTPADTSGKEMSAKILKITSGLQVVVVSSVMGIGGMIFLVIFVGYYRGIFNHLVAQEVLLMSAEIGSAVRPLHGGQNSANAIQELAKGVKAMATALEPIPSRLEKFDNVASQLAAAQLEMGGVVKQLDGALKAQLTQSNQSYGEYKEVLQDFKSYLVDRTESLTSLFQVSGTLGQRLTEMTDRVQKVQEHFETLVAAQKKNQLEYDNYSQLVRNLANEDKIKFRDFSEATIQEIKVSLRESAAELGKSSKDSRETLSGLVQDIKSQVEGLTSSVDSHLRNAQGSQQGLEQVVKAQVEGLAQSVRSHLTNAQESQQNLVKEITSVHKDLQAAQTGHLEKISEKFIEAQDRTSLLLVTVTGELQAYADSINTSSEVLLKKQSLAADSLSQSLEHMVSTLEQSAQSVGHQLAEGSRAQQEKLASAFADQVAAALKELGEFTQTSSASLQQQAKSSQEIQTELSQAVHKSLAVLEEARQRMAENADRWKTSQDLSVQNLFTRWNEEFARRHPATVVASSGEPSAVPTAAPSASAFDSQLGSELKEALQQMAQVMAQMQRSPAPEATPPAAAVAPPVPSEVLGQREREALLSTLSQANQEIREVVETAVGSLSARVEAQEQAWAERHAQQSKTLETLMSNLQQALAARPEVDPKSADTSAPAVAPPELPQALHEFRAYSEAALESLREQTQTNRKWVSEVEKTLEAATQTLEVSKSRLMEGEDRWRSSQELSMQGLFTRWTEEFAQAGLHLPEFQQSLARLDSCLDRLTKLGMHEVLVCAECGAIAPLAEGYCQGCQGSLSSACPQPVFLAKSWNHAQAQLDERLASIAGAVEGLNANLAQLDPGQPAAPAPAPAINLTPLLQSMQGLQEEVRQLRQDNDRHQNRLLALAESEPAPPAVAAAPIAVAPVEPTAIPVSEPTPDAPEPSGNLLRRIWPWRGKK